jgi:hypothetical protein
MPIIISMTTTIIQVCGCIFDIRQVITIIHPDRSGSKQEGYHQLIELISVIASSFASKTISPIPGIINIGKNIGHILIIGPIPIRTRKNAIIIRNGMSNTETGNPGQ